MGTRNLTVVIDNGTHKIAQYGQWDGYPSGQGITALEFCRDYLSTQENIQAFRDKLKNVRFVNNEEIEKLYISLGINLKEEDKFLTHEQAELFDQSYPYFTRNNGAKILEMIMESEGEVLIKDSINFASDSLFCEWCYVVDLDKNTFEVYNERFASFKPHEQNNYSGAFYYPIKLVVKYLLNDLPSNEMFLDYFEKKE